MIFVTGDTHGSNRYGDHSVDGFMHRFNTESFPEQRDMNKNDYVVICGDFGGVWKTDRYSAAEPDSEKYALDWLEDRSFTTLFIPGNHENYDRLIGCKNDRLLESWFYHKMPDKDKDILQKGYPRSLWNGGYVREIRPSVLMLERGEIFNLNGKFCFAYGGAKSHDISDGIIDPADYENEDLFKNKLKSMAHMSYRVRGVSWWDEELPSESEMSHGSQNYLNFLSSHDSFDYIFTHDAPCSDSIFLGYSDYSFFNTYLESFNEPGKHKAWFYGHLHDNRKVFSNHFLLYEQIVRIC